MSCSICSRSSCASWMHSLEEQETCDHGEYKVNCDACKILDLEKEVERLAKELRNYEVI